MSERISSGGVLLVGGDLNAVARVEAACAGTGRAFAHVAAGGLAAGLERYRPALTVVDLDDGQERVFEELSALLATGALNATDVIAFFSHVDEAAGRRASELGVRVLPRGRFWRELSGLLA